MIKIKIENTASFDVDPQNGFTPLCPDELPIEGGNEISGALNGNAEKATYRVGSKDAHPPMPIWKATEEKPTLTPIDGKHENMDVHWNLHCVVGTFGFDFIEGLPHTKEYDFMVYKGLEDDMHPYGACYHDLSDERSTGVIEFFKDKNVENVIVGGLATDFCVATTAKQLKNAGFNVIINLESCRGISPEGIKSEIKIMSEMGISIINNINEIELI